MKYKPEKPERKADQWKDHYIHKPVSRLIRMQKSRTNNHYRNERGKISIGNIH